MPMTEVWTKSGFVSMSIEDAEAFLADQTRQAGLRRIANKCRAVRAFKTACAVVTVGFGLLMILCTAADFFAGASSIVSAVLGMAWAVAGVVCGIETWRGPVVLAPRKDT